MPSSHSGQPPGIFRACEGEGVSSRIHSAADASDCSNRACDRLKLSRHAAQFEQVASVRVAPAARRAAAGPRRERTMGPLGRGGRNFHLLLSKSVVDVEQSMTFVEKGRFEVDRCRPFV
jgi:hypothetical protein